jgi:hypothetical protein
VRSNDVAVEKLNSLAVRPQPWDQGLRQRRLPRSGQSGEPQDYTILLVRHRVAPRSAARATGKPSRCDLQRSPAGFLGTFARSRGLCTAHAANGVVANSPSVSHFFIIRSDGIESVR